MRTPRRRRGLFPPADAPGRTVRFKGMRPVNVLSAAGELVLRRRYYWGRGAGGCCPSDEKAGVAASAVTAGARELCCLMGMSGDFRTAGRDLRRSEERRGGRE